MTVIKEKHLDRREWYTDADRDFSCMYYKDDVFHGGVMAGLGCSKKSCKKQ